MKPSLAILSCTLALLSACDALQADRTALLATSATPAERPSCNACHGYAPRTGAHRFHLDTTAQRVASCHDCHAASIAMSGPVFDSAFRDSQGRIVRTHGWPWLRLDTAGLTFQPDYSAPMDSSPLLARWREPGTEFPEWITRSSSRPDIPGHANGRVDVVISADHDASIRIQTDSGTTRVHMRATWNSQTMSCSSVKCHDEPSREYAWKEPTP